MSNVLIPVLLNSGVFVFKKYIPGVGDLFDKDIVCYKIPNDTENRFDTLQARDDVKSLDREFGQYSIHGKSWYYVPDEEYWDRLEKLKTSSQEYRERQC